MNEFQKLIKAYLDKRAQEDDLFAEHYARAGKTIEKCCNYILNQARKKGGTAVAMPDDEVYGLAVHYYDEDIPESECKPVSGARAAAPKPAVELTEEEKAAAKEEAMVMYRQEQVEVIKQKERDKKRQEAQKQRERAEIFASKQLSLFDL